MRSKCNVDGALVATICNHVGQQVTRTLQREFTRQASCNRRCRHACFPSRLRSSETVFRFWFSEAVCRGRRNHCCANGDATCGRLQNHHRCIKNEMETKKAARLNACAACHVCQCACGCGGAVANCVVYLQQKAPHQPSSQYLQPSKLKHFQSCADNIIATAEQHCS